MIPGFSFKFYLKVKFLTVVLEKTLESLSDSKEIKPVNPKESTLNSHWKD